MAFRNFFTVRSLLRLALMVSLLAIFTTATPAQFTEGDFNPALNGTFIKVIALQTNTQVLIGGDFTSVDSVPRTHIARLNSDGTLDTTFNPGADAPITVLLVQPDGRILVGGSFNQLAGQSHTNVGRLNTDRGAGHFVAILFQPERAFNAVAVAEDERRVPVAAGGGSFGGVAFCFPFERAGFTVDVEFAFAGDFVGGEFAGIFRREEEKRGSP